MNGRYKILHPESSSDWETYYELRFEVLRKPWGQSFDSTKDDTEDGSVHYLVKDEFDDTVAAGRLQFNSSTQGQIRSMAVKQFVQKTGIGRLLIKYIEADAKKRGISEIILDSREQAVPFYLKNGYEVTGPSYLLFGVIPHWKMCKRLA
jgi:GNAT superfamily N-acetyltransferase